MKYFIYFYSITHNTSESKTSIFIHFFYYIFFKYVSKFIEKSSSTKEPK